jgi:hypothetical protein
MSDDIAQVGRIHIDDRGFAFDPLSGNVVQMLRHDSLPMIGWTLAWRIAAGYGMALAASEGER